MLKNVKRKLAIITCYILVISITMSSVIVFAEDSIGLLPLEGNLISEEVQGNVLPNDGADIPSLLPENGNVASEDVPSQLPLKMTTYQPQNITANSGIVTVELTYDSDTIATGGTLTFKDLNEAELKFKLTGSNDKDRKVTFTVPKGLELVSGTGIRNLDADGKTVARGYTPSEIFMFGYNYPVWNLDPKEPVEGILPAPNPIMSKSGTLEYTIVDETDGADIWIKVKMNRDFVNYNLTGQLITLLNDIEVELTGSLENPQKFNFEVKAIAEKGRLNTFELSATDSQFPDRSAELRLSYERRHPYEDAYIQNLYDPEFDFTFNSKAKLTLASSWTEKSRKDNGNDTTTVRLKYSGHINIANVVFGSLLYDGTNFPVNTICEVKLENFSYRSLFYDKSKSQLEVNTVNQPEIRSATTKIIVMPVGVGFEMGFHKEAGYKENFLENNTDPVLLFSAAKNYIKGNLFYADIKFRGDFDPDVDNITKVVMGMPVLGTPPGYNMYDLDKYPYFKKITVKYAGEAPIDLYSGTGYNMGGTTWASRGVSITPNVNYSMTYFPYGQAPSQVTFTAPTGKSFEWIEVELNGDRNTRGDWDTGFYVYGRPKTDTYTGIYSNNYFSIYTKDTQGNWTPKATSKIGGFRWKEPLPAFKLDISEGRYDTEPYTYSQGEYNFLGHSMGTIIFVGFLQLKGYTGENTKDEIKISINVDEQDAVRGIRFPYGYRTDKEDAIKQVKEVKWEFFDDPTTYIWINDGGKPPFGYDSTGGVIDAPGQVGGLDEKRFKSLEVTLDGWGSSPKESSISLRGYLKDREVTGKKGQHQIKITAKSQGGNETEIYSGNIGREFLPQTSAAVHIATNDLEVNAGASGKLNFRINGNMYNKQTIAMVLPRGITVGTVITNVYDPVKKRNLEMVNDTARTRDLTSGEIKKVFGANTTIKAAKLYVFNLENQNINSKTYYHGGWLNSGYNVTAELKVATWHPNAMYNMSQILYAGTNQTGVNSFGTYVANEGKIIDNFINLGTTTKIVTGREKDQLKINVNPGISMRAEAAGSDGIFKTFIAGNDHTATILEPNEKGTIRYTITNNINMENYPEKDVYLFLPLPSKSNKAFANLVNFDFKMIGPASLTEGSANADKIEIKYTNMTSSKLVLSDRAKYFANASDTLSTGDNVVVVKLTNVTYADDKPIVFEIPVEAPDKTLKTKPDEKIYTNMAPKYMFPFLSGNYAMKDLYDKDINNPIQFGFYNPEWTVNFKNVLMHENGSIADMTNPVINGIKVTNDEPIYEANSTVAAGNKLPSDPTMNGHVFEGWYLDNNLQTPFIAYDGTNGVDATKITKNTTIYAKWTSTNANYTIKHWKEDSGGNSWTVFVTDTETKSGKIGERPTFNSKTYADFVNSQKPTTYEKNGTNASTNPLTIAADGTLVVNLYYDLIRYNVTYIEGTGTNLRGIRNIEVFHGQKPTSVPTVTAKKDYEWNDKWEDEDKKVYTSQQVKDLSIVKSMRFTVVADLLPLAKVTLNYDGGTNRDTGNDRDTFEGGEGSNIPFPTKDKIIRNTDEELIGWDVQSTISWGSEKFGARGTNTTYRAKYGTLGTVSFDMNAPDSKPASIANKRLLVGDKLTSSSFWPDVSGETKGKEITRPGYAFAGWYTDDKLEDKDKVNDTIEMKASQTLNLYAKWIPGLDTPYKLIHHKEQIGGGVIKEEEDLKGETGGFAAVRPKTFIGYTFKANNTNYENSSVSTSQNTPLPIIADGSLKVNLYYDLKEYNVKFLANNATLTGTADFTVKHGDKVSTVPTVTPNANYEWNGNWSGSDGKTYTSTQIRQLAITDNITFTATATLKEYNVKFLANNATLTGTADFTVKHGDKVSTVPTVTPNANYAWNGNWSGSDGKTYTSTQIRQLAITDNITFTATATLKEYNVKFLANNATLTGTADFTVKHGDKVSTVPTVTPNANYAWNGNWSGSDGKTYTSTQIGQLVITDNITFTATATLKEYNVKFVANNATLTGTADFTVKHGDKVSTVPTVTPNANYAWNGNWSGSDGQTYTSTQIGQLAITDNITFTATATLKEYNVKFLANNATLTGTADFTVKHGDKVSAVPTVTPNANYAWNNKWKDGSGKEYTITEIENLAITENIIFTAAANLKEYEIKFSATDATINGGINDVTVTVKHGEKVASVPTVTPNANYQWNNKWNDRSGKEYTSAEIENLAITGNMTFTATATLKEYQVKFVASNATLTGTADFTVKHGDKVNSVPTVAPDTNYQWNNKWKDGSGKEYTITEIENLAITENIIFTAAANLKEYEIKFSATDATINGGINDVTVTVKHGEKIASVPTVTPNANYQWNNKWNDRSGKEYTSAEIENLAITGNMTFTATATLKEYQVKFVASNATLTGTADFTVKHGDKVNSVPTVAPDANYQWNNKWNDRSGKEYKSTEIENLAITGNMTFTATATLLPAPEVNLDFGGGQDESGNTIRKIIGSEGDSVTIVGEDKITRDGYTLTGWTPEIPKNFGARGTTSTHTAVWIKKYTITSSADANGSITPTGAQTVTKGDEKTFTFTANQGYKIAQVLIDGVNDANAVTSGSYTFTNIQANKTIEVTFSKKSDGGSSSSKPDPEPEPNPNEKPEVTLETGTKPKLTTERIAYIAGYEDGSFRPYNAMTRAEVAVVLSNLIEEKPANASDYLNFTDTNQNEWYADKVGHIISLGIMGGYPDGSFRPYDKVTRAEFATIASNFDELEEKQEIDFIDLTTDHWAYDYISMATSRNWVGGYADGSFRPESGITRAEVVVVMNNMLNRSGGKVEIEQIIKSFKDVPLEHWAYLSIVEATHSHKYIESEKNQ